MFVSKSEDNLQEPVCPYTLQLPGIKSKSSHLVTRAWTTEPPLWPVDSMAKGFCSLVTMVYSVVPYSVEICRAKSRQAGHVRHSPSAEVRSLPRGDEVTGSRTKGDGLSKQTCARTTHLEVCLHRKCAA